MVSYTQTHLRCLGLMISHSILLLKEEVPFELELIGKRQLLNTRMVEVSLVAKSYVFFQDIQIRAMTYELTKVIFRHSMPSKWWYKRLTIWMIL